MGADFPTHTHSKQSSSNTISSSSRSQRDLHMSQAQSSFTSQLQRHCTAQASLPLLWYCLTQAHSSICARPLGNTQHSSSLHMPSQDLQPLSLSLQCPHLLKQCRLPQPLLQLLLLGISQRSCPQPLLSRTACIHRDRDQTHHSLVQLPQLT